MKKRGQAGSPRSARRNSRAARRSAHPARRSGFIFASLAVLALLLPGAYTVEMAGPALDVTGEVAGTRLVNVEGVPTYPTDTQLYMTTVSAAGNPEAGTLGAHALWALVDQESQLLPVRLLYPPTLSSAEDDARNAELMNNSQTVAAGVALEKAGHHVTMKLRVVEIPEGSPAAGQLETDDIITGIAAPGTAPTTVSTFGELSKVLYATEPGSTVTVSYQRGGESGTTTIITAPFPADETGWVHPGSLLGVSLAVEDVQLPATVTYAVEGIGGPSAGLMFALGMYDELTPGSLGGSAVIAGTGTLAFNGEVGPIGGIQHKIVGARDRGATDFLAPAANCGETIGYEPEGLRIWAVRNFDDAAAAVRAIGAGRTPALPTCQDLAAGR